MRREYQEELMKDKKFGGRDVFRPSSVCSSLLGNWTQARYTLARVGYSADLPSVGKEQV